MPDLVNTAGKDAVDFLWTGKGIIRVWPRSKLNHAAVIAACNQTDRRKRSNHSLFGSPQALQVTPGTLCYSSGLILRYHFIFTAETECRCFCGDTFCNTEPRIASFNEPAQHHLPDCLDKTLRIVAIGMRQLDGCRSILACIGDAGIEKELMAADNGVSGKRSDAFQDKAGQLVGSWSIDDIGIIDAYENHEDDPESADFSRCLRKWKKQSAPIKPAAAPHKV